MIFPFCAKKLHLERQLCNINFLKNKLKIVHYRWTLAECRNCLVLLSVRCKLLCQAEFVVLQQSPVLVAVSVNVLTGKKLNVIMIYEFEENKVERNTTSLVVLCFRKFSTFRYANVCHLPDARLMNDDVRYICYDFTIKVQEERFPNKYVLWIK